MTASPRTCFYIPPDQHDENGWIPSVVTVEGADEDEPGTTEPKIMIEARGTFTVGVNDVENTYGGG